MEMSDAVLMKLKCKNCKGYLSRAPVLLLEDGKSSCGRCIELEENSRRNLPYEELAKLMSFPCRYKENGCQEKVPFEDNKEHEEACAYQLYLCPIAESVNCKWSGGRNSLMEHCRAEHPGNVVENPFKLTYNITKSGLQNYLLSAFKVLFLIQTRVCVISKKIYQAVRLIGDPRNAAKYQFVIDIENKDNRLTTTGNVAPQESLTLNEDTSLAMSINGFLEMLGDLRDTVFTLTVRSSDPGYTEKSMAKGNDTNKLRNVRVQGNCVQCKLLSEPIYQNDKLAWLCKICTSARIKCKNQCKGCTHMDSKNKCLKHGYYYCPYSAKCQICEKVITDVTINVHYRQTHRNITYLSGTEFSINPTFHKFQWCIINTDFGNALCMYMLLPEVFHLDVRIPFPSEDLYMYKCIIKIYDLEQRRALTRTPDVQYNSIADWCLRIPRVEFNLYIPDGKCNIKINFIKNENPCN